MPGINSPALGFALPCVYVSEPVIWEYKQVTSDGVLDEAALNELGREGWELTAILPHDARVVFFFKRQVEPSDKA